MISIKRSIASLGVSLFALTPVLVSAQEFKEFTNFAVKIMAFINGTLVPLVFTLAFIVFLWGMFRFFVYGGHDENEQSKGKQLMIYGIVGFVLMVSIWGIVNLLANGLGFSGEGLQNMPDIPTR